MSVWFSISGGSSPNYVNWSPAQKQELQQAYEDARAWLASGLTAGIAAVAQYRDIQLNSVSATIEGDMDIQGILGIDSDVRNGFDGIRITYDIDAKASLEDIEAGVAQSQKRSAVYDIVTNPTNVAVKVN